MSEVILLSDSNESLSGAENDSPKNTNENKNNDLLSVVDQNDFDFPEVHFNHSSNVNQVPKSRNNSNERSPFNIDSEKLENDVEDAFPITEKNSKERCRTSSDSTENSDEEKKKRKNHKNVKAVQKKVKNQVTEERLERQKQLQKERALKKIAFKKSRNIKPGECMKFIEVVLDKELIPNSITWKRVIENSYVNESNEISTTTDIEKVDQTLIIWNWNEAVTKVADGSFCTTISHIKTLLPNNNFILVVFGIEDYFTYRNQTKNSVKTGAKNKTQKSNAKSSYEFINFPEISMQEFEMCLNEIQITTRCNSKLIENSQDLALMVYQCTKAVAETPYKTETNKKLMSKFDWYVMGDNRNTVCVDKDGNGLKRLWQQQLCQFNLSSLEIAEAICSVYPSPVDLAEAYMNCTDNEGVNLLKDIPIRRATGPLTAVRKVGPELSRKIYIMFTSREGENELN